MGADVVNRHNVRVVEHPGGASLLFETLQTFRVIGIGGRKYFDRDFTAEARVTGAIYFAHPSGADRSQDLIWAEPSAFRELHNSTANFTKTIAAIWRSYSFFALKSTSGPRHEWLASSRRAGLRGTRIIHTDLAIYAAQPSRNHFQAIPGG